MADKFNSSLSVNMVDELTKDLDIILDNPTMFGDDTINTLNQKLFDVLTNAAKQIIGCIMVCTKRIVTENGLILIVSKKERFITRQKISMANVKQMRI